MLALIPVFRHIALDQPDAPWRFYRQPGDAETTPRPSYALRTAFEHAKLFRIVHETILTYCGHNGRVSAFDVSLLYDRYLGWMEDLPELMRAGGGNEDVLPHVLFLQLRISWRKTDEVMMVADIS